MDFFHIYTCIDRINWIVCFINAQNGNENKIAIDVPKLLLK